MATNQLAGAVILAVIGATLKFSYDAWATRRANRLERLNRQLALLYGPMLALSYASREAWKAFRTIYRPPADEPYWPLSGEEPSAAEAEAWRTWMREVFMPINDQLRRLIVEHADLLEESEIPKPLLDFCAHVETYRGRLKQWEAQDFSQHVSALNYPAALDEYAGTSYKALKARQAALIRAGA